MDGVVLAGARAPEELQERGIDRIPLLRIDGETLIARACRCLLEGGGCERVFVLAPSEVELPADDRVLRADYSGDVIQDLIECLKQRAVSQYVLISSADMPLLTPEAVSALTAAGLEHQADIVFPTVERGRIEQRFPGTKRTYLRLGRLTVSGGNLFWISRPWLIGRAEWLKRLFANRKSIPAMARTFGVLFLLRILLGWTSLEYVERHLGRIVQGSLKAVVLDYPEVAVDLDKLADLELFAADLDPWAEMTDETA